MYNDCLTDDSPVFKQRNGERFLDRNFRDSYWKPFMELHNLESHHPHDTRYTFSTFWDYCHLDTRDGEVILGHGSKSDITKLYKTPELKHRYNELCKLRFDGEIPGPEKEIVYKQAKPQMSRKQEKCIQSEGNTVAEFLKMKQEMNELGFTDMAEYMEHKKLQQEMQKLGFTNEKDYFDYLEYIKLTR